MARGRDSARSALSGDRDATDTKRHATLAQVLRERAWIAQDRARAISATGCGAHGAPPWPRTSNRHPRRRLLPGAGRSRPRCNAVVGGRTATPRGRTPRPNFHNGTRIALARIMRAVTQILVATDFSAASQRALKTATGLAARFGAAITVLHVVEGAPYPYALTPAPWLLEAAQAHLDKTLATLQTEGLNARGVLREGVPWREICSAAADLSPDVVVIGSHGRHGLPRFILGSVAERVVRVSPVPVLTVPPSDDVAVVGSIPERVGRILAPTDFSETSQRGVDAAVTIALALGAALTLVYVYEPPNSAYHLFFADVAAEASRTVQRPLDELLTHIRLRLPDAEAIARVATPWVGILDVAKDRSADMIVIGTHGRRGLEHAFLGSVAEKIVRLSPVPVLTVGAN